MARLLSLAALLFLACAAALGAANGAAAKALAAADDAWDRGDYISALNGYIKLLEAPGADDAVFESIALKTGELFETRELSPDGRNPRFSPDGKYVAYESGLEVSRRTQVLRNDGTLTEVAELPGVSAAFSPASSTVAYLKISGNAELAAAAKAVDDTPLAAQNRNGLIQALTWQVLRNSTLVIRELESGQEREIATPGLLKAGLTFSSDGRTLYFLGGREGEEDRNDIYAVSEAQPPARVGDAPGLKSAPIVEPTGTVLLYTVTTQNPFRKPLAPGQGQGQGGGFGTQPRAPSFGVIDLAANKTTMIEGAAPSLSADGKSMTYVARTGAEYSVMVGAPRGPFAAVKKTANRIDAPALSRDGSRIVFQMMTRDDWELYSVHRDGSGEARLTRDIQHDLLPRFIGTDRLLWVVGEARHRRSYLLDLAAGRQLRLFHNNSVRTIAPEYQWIVSGDGSQVLIGAERDGDTVSPARGVYLVDLRKKVARADLLTRLKTNLASETALKTAATKTFGPIAAEVRRVLGSASVARVYGYEKALFDFDSKHISRPGNKLAADYLFRTYASFGYEPAYQWLENRNALGGKTANVIATLRGTVNPELVYVVSSHYDSVAGGPGADDDSSGTAALLEAARVLADNPQPATIVFASFTGEESGLLGSREFVRQAVANKMQIVGALNNDMIGFANDQRLDNTIRYSNPGIRDIQHGAAMLFTRLITYDALYFKGTDAAAYYDAYGDIVGGIGSYPVLSSPHYHQAHDLLEFENHELITETSKTTAATLMLLASSPSRIKDLNVEAAGGAATVTWTPSPEKGITSYIVAYGPASAPASKRVTVKSPRAQLAAVPSGTVIAVKAINAKGLEGWDWARVTVP
jgi:Tol biopolymer transport system component